MVHIMNNIKMSLLIIQLIFIRTTYGIGFIRTIQAVGFPYYKIMFVLGNCKEQLLLVENKVWGNVKLNRIFDIYYKSSDPNFKVSRVEISIVINNTDCFAHSASGVGSSVFSGTLYLPVNSGVVLYHLNIFTCNKNDFLTLLSDSNDENDETEQSI
ncbi:uncharacterized protein LOC113517996 [Galleria mellonella]|uniref:Uncharacterized protein LOC113517996 n=1 Tax=Galleria mellonella TaxID=7137 RepID=A0A6J1WSR8_GALME|nr:uncharacterized protein LOC113517996 [Galleria mellonella]